MTAMHGTEDVTRWEELRDYVWATPLGRFWINFWRKRFGEPPFRLKEARAELRAYYAPRNAARPP